MEKGSDRSIEWVNLQCAHHATRALHFAKAKKRGKARYGNKRPSSNSSIGHCARGHRRVGACLAHRSSPLLAGAASHTRVCARSPLRPPPLVCTSAATLTSQPSDPIDHPPRNRRRAVRFERVVIPTNGFRHTLHLQQAAVAVCALAQSDTLTPPPPQRQKCGFSGRP